MSIDLMSAVWERGPTNSTEKFVLISLADHADTNGRCWPSFDKTATRCSLSRRTVIRTVAALEAAGWLTREHRMRPGKQQMTSNGYRISIERLMVTHDHHDGDTVSPSDTEIVTHDHHHSDTVSLGGDTVSPLIVTQCHPNPNLNPQENPQGNHQRARVTKSARQQQPTPKKIPPPIFTTKLEISEDPETRAAEGYIVRALADVTGMDGMLNFDPLLLVGRDLIALSYTPEQVRVAYGRDAPPGRWNWYTDDWRGKRGDRPTLKNITETIGGAVQTTKPADPEAGGILWLDHVKSFDTGS